MPIIILEGPDGAGKSTLAEKLVNDYGYAYQHHGLYQDSGEELLERYTQSILQTKPTVVDRCFLSEHVYGTVMRNHDRLGAIGFNVLTRLTRATGVSEVMVMTSWKNIEKNWLEKRKEKFDPVNKKGDYVDAVGKIKKIYDLYDKVRNTFHHYHLYDYDWEKTIARADLVAEAFMTNSIEWYRPNLSEGVIGSPTAKYLIVGEQVNVRKAKRDLPFYTLNGTGLYLTRALHVAGFKESDLAFTNAIDIKGKKRFFRPLLRRFVKNEPRIIALGETAHQVLKEQGFPHATLPHPSFWMRWKSKSFQAYVNMFKENHENRVDKFLRCLGKPVNRGNGKGK